MRKLAKDLGVDLRTLTPSGPDGTVTREDVQSAAASAIGWPSLRLGRSSLSRPVARGRPREPIKGVRKAMAQAMVGSAFTAPHVTEWVTVDVTRTMKLVERLKAHRDFRDVRVSPLLVLAKAVCLAVRRTPEVNATWDEQPAGGRPQVLRATSASPPPPPAACWCRTSRTPTRCRCPSSARRSTR